jgi:hypothetical protein
MADQPALPNKRAPVVDVGAFVEIELIDAGDQREGLSFNIVVDAQADFKNGFLGEGTPLAQAIMGHPAGVTVPYRADEIIAVYIRSVQPGQAAPGQDVAARRQETLRKAAEQSDLTSTMLFASSFSGKWGDYDPTSLVDEWEQKSKEEKEE